MLPYPFSVEGLPIVLAMFLSGVVLCWLIRNAIARIDLMAQSRKALNAAYARFHGFLLVVKLATMRQLE